MNVAIVEDDDGYARTLKEYLGRYSEERGVRFEVTRYSEAVSFLENYRPRFAIVLMDIELPMMNGMDAARKMREKDDRTCLIFVTNMAQFACDGYGVDALDFIVKPVSYADFSMKLDRAVRRARTNEKVDYYIPVAGGDIALATVPDITQGEQPLEVLAQDDPGTLVAMREACRHILYATVYSNAMNGLAPGSIISYTLAPWQIVLVVVSVVVYAFAAFVAVMLVLRFADTRRHPENYR